VTFHDQACRRIAASHGLFEGGRWCFSDCGQTQVEFTAPACGAMGGLLECDIPKTRNVYFWPLAEMSVA
ncbi:MAG: hypothetical protein WCF56_17185, partial [Pseudolabrys sp.]